MLNKDIQQIRIDIVEMLLEACKDESERMHERTEEYLRDLKSSLIEYKEFYNGKYKGW